MSLVTITERWTDATFSSERLVGDAGSGAPSCFADAKRSANKTCGGEERSDELESSAVSPGEAKALVVSWRGKATTLMRQASMFEGHGGYDSSGALWRTVAGVLEDCANDLEDFFGLAPKPDSKLVKRASGRRNAAAETREE